MTHRMAGFQWIAPWTPRAADGVIASWDTRSTSISGRVKQTYSPQTCSFMPYGPIVLRSDQNRYVKQKNT